MANLIWTQGSKTHERHIPGLVRIVRYGAEHFQNNFIIATRISGLKRLIQGRDIHMILEAGQGEVIYTNKGRRKRLTLKGQWKVLKWLIE